ncbi:RNA polymerase sigma factor [Methylosinus sporium]|uniref:RNA polymerase sigma factor n=1 Tax=Methylosinus sporium TaxID=428 RepID=UPI003DA6F24F
MSLVTACSRSLERRRRRGLSSVIQTNRARLCNQLVESYDELVRQLTRRLGSSDFAYEALHEAFLRLDRVGDAALVQSPKDYIFRTAINIAKDYKKAGRRRVSAAAVDALLEICDEAPDPARIAEARSEIEAFKRAMAELPARRREVLRKIAVEGLTAEEVATNLQVTTRTVEADLKNALTHCADRLRRKRVLRLGGPRPKS